MDRYYLLLTHTDIYTYLYLYTDSTRCPASGDPCIMHAWTQAEVTKCAKRIDSPTAGTSRQRAGSLIPKSYSESRVLFIMLY